MSFILHELVEQQTVRHTSSYLEKQFGADVSAEFRGFTSFTLNRGPALSGHPETGFSVKGVTLE